LVDDEDDDGVVVVLGLTVGTAIEVEVGMRAEETWALKKFYEF
jgi:hypothetical protein